MSKTTRLELHDAIDVALRVLNDLEAERDQLRETLAEIAALLAKPRTGPRAMDEAYVLALHALGPGGERE